MKFTKEQIETAIAVLHSQGQNEEDVISIKDLITNLNLLLKPKRKKIVVEIECNYPKEFPLNEHSIRAILNCGCSESGLDWKVTELPEVFSREDISEIFASQTSDVDRFINKWLSERSKK